MKEIKNKVFTLTSMNRNVAQVFQLRVGATFQSLDGMAGQSPLGLIGKELRCKPHTSSSFCRQVLNAKWAEFIRSHRFGDNSRVRFGA